MWRVGEVPFTPCNVFIMGIAAYFACVPSYPGAVAIREMVEMWPKPNGVCQFDNNYRKAAIFAWYHEWSNNIISGFFKNYFWK